MAKTERRHTYTHFMLQRNYDDKLVKGKPCFKLRKALTILNNKLFASASCSRRQVFITNLRLHSAALSSRRYTHAHTLSTWTTLERNALFTTNQSCGSFCDFEHGFWNIGFIFMTRNDTKRGLISFNTLLSLIIVLQFLSDTFRVPFNFFVWQRLNAN